MRFLLVFLAFFIGLSTSSASENQNVNEKVNATYAQFVKAFNQLNAELIQPIYDPDAIYIPEHKQGDLIRGKEDINLIYQRFFNRVKHKKAQVKIGFRVINRDITKDRVTDLGYYLIRFIPAAHTEQPISEFSGKFLIISKPDIHGGWQWSTEMNNKAKSSFYFDAKPQAELFYTHSKPLKRDKQ